MGRILKTLAALTGVVLLHISFASADSQPPAVGGVLPDFSLAVPKNDAQQSYLGVSGKEVFTIPEIEADVVIIEIFSMY